ncbi:MAG: ABC transporter ATP-binding protein [Verrucomicrobia bacterium]|nr:ABC transporter ATP-binding protein [Verrucomicrobiota bacterium]
MIEVESLGKSYRISHQRRERYSSLRDVLSEKVRGLFRRRSADAGSTSVEDFWALRDVAFTVQPGEVLGIIGRNGAGKSTLLKILSQITEPSTGRVRLRGRVASLLEVGTGFHPELTGRENIFLNGSILGMTRAEIRRKFDAIVAFAEIEKFLDTPVKRYSSGMYVRLAFSVAAHMEPEILIVDEVLAVGDVGFQRKCMDHMKKLVKSGVTVLMVSHNMFAVKALCGRALVLAGGRLQFDGPAAEGIRLYESDSRLEADPWAVGVIGEEMSRWPIVIKRVETLDEKGEPRTIFNHGERMRFRIEYELRRPVKFPNFCIGVRRADNVSVCSFSAARDGLTTPLLERSGTVEMLTAPLRLVAELYSTHVIVWDRDFKTLHCGQMGPVFHVRDEVLNSEFGVFNEPAEWQWQFHGAAVAEKIQETKP